MRFLVILIIFISNAAQSQGIAAKIDSLLTAYYNQDQFSGTVLVAKDDQVIFEKGYGYANREANIPNKPETEYRIGSISKTFTATLIMKLQEIGLLSVSDPVSRYIPDYPKGDSILLFHLLNHTSGIRSITSMPQYYKSWISQPTDLETTISRFQNEPLLFTPGQKFNYSNSNYILLSYIAEKAAGASFDKLLEEKILKDLRMYNTGMDMNERPSPIKAKGYQLSASRDFDDARFNDMSVMSGAGSMFSTAKDLLKWHQAFFSGDLLNDESMRQMFAAGKNGYGLGWEVDSVKGRLRISHSGSIDGFISNFIRYPKEGICIIFLSNYFNSNGPAICKALTSIAFNESYEMPVQRNFIRLDEKVMENYVGTYEMENGPSINIFIEGGKLKGRLGKQDAFHMQAQENDIFYVKPIDSDFHINLQTGLLEIRKGTKVMKFVKKV